MKRNHVDCLFRKLQPLASEKWYLVANYQTRPRERNESCLCKQTRNVCLTVHHITHHVFLLSAFPCAVLVCRIHFSFARHRCAFSAFRLLEGRQSFH